MHILDKTLLMFFDDTLIQTYDQFYFLTNILQYITVYVTVKKIDFEFSSKYLFSGSLNPKNGF